MTQFQLERPLITFLLPPHPSDNGTHLLKPNLCTSLHREPGGKAPISLINLRQGRVLIPRLFLIRTRVCSVITSQESHTPCTLTPQPQAANTSQGLCAHLIPTQHLGWAPKRNAWGSPHLDATHPLPSSPPALAGLHLPQCPNRADSPAATQGLCSAPTREKGKLTPWSFSPCRHPQKSNV